MNKVILAKEYAKKKHEGQKRSTGEDYYIHCLRVFNILKARTGIENILIAGLLHDVLEDTNTNYDEVKDCFGSEVANLVLECSKPYDTLHSRPALMIKFADMLDNVADRPKDAWVKRKIKAIKDSSTGN